MKKNIVKVTSSSNKDDHKVTIRTSQLSKKIKFKDGDIFYIQFNNKFVLRMSVSRCGTTLYHKGGIGVIPIGTQLPCIDNPVYWTINKIVRA